MKASLAALLALLLLPFAANAADQAFTLESSSFKDGDVLPVKHAMEGVPGGKNLSPALSWRNAPAGTKSFAVLCVDAHPVAGGWIHWALLNLPGDCQELPEGLSRANTPPGAWTLLNSYRKPGWGGPMPPPGSGVHKYVFTVYALSLPPASTCEISSGFISEERFLKACERSLLGKASLTATFERK